LTQSQTQARVFQLERGVNFRDIGGYSGDGGRTVLWRLLYRSGSTLRMNSADRTALASHPIRTVVDLRSRRERRQNPHILSREKSVCYHAFEHDHAGGDILKMLARPEAQEGALRDMMIGLYAALPYQFAATFRQLFIQAATGPLPLMFNCTAGKDRTGVAAALLLSALGVGWDDVMEDYLLTERFVPTIMDLYGKRLLARHPRHLTPELLAPVFGVRPDYLQTMRQAILSRNGSIEAYLRHTLELDAAMLRQFKDRLLGDAPCP
jgi:protein-tyrosine phosphatase